MNTAALIALIFILGCGAGALLATASYTMELRRCARFLRQRDDESNARLTRGAPAPGLSDMIDAVNEELDRASQARTAALRHRQELQRDLSALSHDIRTPLTGANGYLQLAEREEDPGRRRAHFECARQRIDATAALLDQLFAYTKASDPDLTLDCEPVALKPLVEQVLLGHVPAFEQRGWEPALAADPEDAAICGDRTALARIVENLVANALRHGVEAPRIAVGRGSLRIENRVADPDAIEVGRLFERFYQADSARGRSGAGLGLATCARLAHAMGLELSARMHGETLAIELRER